MWLIIIFFNRLFLKEALYNIYMTIDADNKNFPNKADGWENIDTVLLDMDGTLLDLHFDTKLERQIVNGFGCFDALRNHSHFRQDII